MVGWHHWLNGHEFEQTLGDSEGQGSLVCCSPWSCKQLDMTKQLNNQTHTHIYFIPTPTITISINIFQSSFVVYKEVHTDVSLEDSCSLLTLYCLL